MTRPRNSLNRFETKLLAALVVAGLGAWPLSCSTQQAVRPPASAKGPAPEASPALASAHGQEFSQAPWDGPIQRADAPRRLALLQELNRIRAGHGLDALKPSPDLDRAAQAHAEDMLRRGYFTHESPEGKTAFDRVARLAPGAIALDVRENLHYLAATPAAPVETRIADANADWMDSPGHRENMLNASSEHVGFGLAARPRDGGGIEELTVQVFGVAGGWWEGVVPPREARAPSSWRVRTRQPLEFFLYDDSEPGRRYPDPVRRGRYWVGGTPLGLVDGAGLVSLPALAPGEYALAVRRPGRDKGWHEARRLRIVP